MKLLASLRPAALTLLLFLIAYLPAFAVVGGLHLSLAAMVPAVMLVSFAVAVLCMGFYVWRGWLAAADFGWRWPPRRDVAYALILSIPLSALAAWALSHAREPGPLGGLHLAPWLVYLYFAIGAPVQEETIFRGLLQSALTRSLALRWQGKTASGIAASLAVAVLFGVIHLRVGPVTALGALVLAILAGELRRRSASLLPAMLCHAIFNLGGILWATQ